MNLTHAAFINTPDSDRWLLCTVRSTALDADAVVANKIASGDLPRETMKRVRSFGPREKIPNWFPLEPHLKELKEEIRERVH
jgi:hypothetical protein